MSDSRATMLLSTAWEHPALFGPFFPGSTWDNWKVFAKAMLGEPISDEDLEIYRECTGRTAAPSTPFTEACLVVGRRGGKSRVLATIAVYLACFRTYHQYLAPGEVATIAIIAASRSQSRSIYRYALGLLKSTRILKERFLDEKKLTTDSITLKNRVVIEIQAASHRVTRGYTFASILADETAFWKSEESSNPDTEIFRALCRVYPPFPVQFCLTRARHIGKPASSITLGAAITEKTTRGYWFGKRKPHDEPRSGSGGGCRCIPRRSRECVGPSMEPSSGRT